MKKQLVDMYVRDIPPKYSGRWPLPGNQWLQQDGRDRGLILESHGNVLDIDKQPQQFFERGSLEMIRAFLCAP